VKVAYKFPWLAVGMGSLATVIGITLSAMNARSESTEAGTYLILGGILTAFGPIVLSHAVSKRLGQREAREELDSRMDSISMNLGQSVIALDSALKRWAANVDEPHVTLSIVASVVSAIEVQISQLQKLIGTPFSSESILNTKRDLTKLAGNLAKAVEVDDPEALREANRDIQKVLRRLNKSPLEEARTEEVRCPIDGAAQSVPLPDVPGATAHPTCPKCGETFAVHRDGRGTVFVRISSRNAAAQAVPSEGSAPQPTRSSSPVAAHGATASERPSQVALSCPSCEKEVKFWQTGAARQPLVCLSCDTGFAVSDAGAILDVEKFSRGTVPVHRVAQKNFFALCAHCGTEHRCAIRQGGDYFGFCEEDKVILVIPAAVAEEHLVRSQG
jgi:hypothetical protein